MSGPGYIGNEFDAKTESSLSTAMVPCPPPVPWPRPILPSTTNEDVTFYTTVSTVKFLQFLRMN